MTQPRLENPFRIAGAGPKSNKPLCPWRTPAHHDLYVDVGTMGEAFARFKTELMDCASLREQGSLVVVSGDDRCGKTSVAHRCAEYVNGKVNDAASETFIVDLSDYRYSAENVAGRVGEVFGEVTTQLAHRVALVDDESAEGRAELPRQVDRLCRTAEENSRVLIVLLPRSEIVNELPQYASLALRQRNIVFFAECADIEKVTDVLDEMRPAQRDDVLRLDVSPLTAADFWTFAESRLKRHSKGSVHWTTKPMMDKVADALRSVSPVPIGLLQELLYGVWEDQASAPKPRRIGGEDILHYYITHYVKANVDGHRREPRGRDR